MAYERPGYREMLARLDDAFPGRELLDRRDIASWLGVDPKTVTRRYHFPKGKVSKTMIAKAVSSS